MASEFTMPKLGLTMEGATIVDWLVADRAEVVSGEAVLLIETDKVETEVMASASGVLHRVGLVGTSYACGDRIGWITAPGEAPPVAPGDAPQMAPVVAPPAVATASTAQTAQAASTDLPVSGRLFASPNARRVAADLGVDLRTVQGSGPGGRIVSGDVELAATRTPAATPAPSTAVNWRPGVVAPSATFAARVLADELGLDLATVTASSTDGRVTRDDVAQHARRIIAAVSLQGRSAAEVAPRATPPLLQQPTSVVPMRGMRGTIAQRMHDSLRDMAQLTLHMDVDMTWVVADREARRSAGAAPSYTDYVIAAAAVALRLHPIVNSQITDDGVAMLPRIDIGLAVALDDGLVVPVVRDVPRLDLATLAAATSKLAAAARARSLQHDEVSGGTFTVTALGMYGVDGFTPIVNAPNTAILGVGRIRTDTRWVDDRPHPVPVLTLSLTWDHRAFDGAPAAAFTRAIADALESGELA